MMILVKLQETRIRYEEIEELAVRSHLRADLILLILDGRRFRLITIRVSVALVTSQNRTVDPLRSVLEGD